MLGVGNLGAAVGRPRGSSASTKRPRVHSCRFPESSCSANNFTSTFMEVFPTAITRATNSTSCPWWTGVWKSTRHGHHHITTDNELVGRGLWANPEARISSTRAERRRMLPPRRSSRKSYARRGPDKSHRNVATALISERLRWGRENNCSRRQQDNDIYAQGANRSGRKCLSGFN